MFINIIGGATFVDTTYSEIIEGATSEIFISSNVVLDMQDILALCVRQSRPSQCINRREGRESGKKEKEEIVRCLLLSHEETGNEINVRPDYTDMTYLHHHYRNAIRSDIWEGHKVKNHADIGYFHQSTIN